MNKSRIDPVPVFVCPGTISLEKIADSLNCCEMAEINLLSFVVD